MNCKGLSIFEVMIAVLMVGVCVTGLASLQGALSRAVFTSHALIDRLGFIRSFFVEAQRDRVFEKEKDQKKIIEDPSLTMTYSIAKPTNKSLKSFQNIEVETINAEYPTIFGQRKESFARLRFIVRPEKKNERV